MTTNSKEKLPVWLPLFFLVLSFVLVWLFRDQIIQYIATPFSKILQYLGWFIGLLGRALDQYLIWGTFIIISTIITITSLVTIQRGYASENNSQQLQGEISQWVNRLNNANRGIYFKWQLSQHIAPLILETLAYKQGLQTSQVFYSLKQKKLDIPKDILTYLQIAYSEDAHLFFSTNPKAGEQSSPLNISINKIINYLDDELNQNEKAGDIYANANN